MGVASCLHSFLFSNEMDLTERHSTPSDSVLKFFPQLNLVLAKELITIPTNSMKRYWDKVFWNELFRVLLNSKQIGDFSCIIEHLEDFLAEKAASKTCGYHKVAYNFDILYLHLRLKSLCCIGF